MRRFFKDSQDKYGYRYGARDLPRASNYFFYAYRCFAKLVLYVLAGLFAGILFLIVVPFMRLVMRNDQSFKHRARSVVSFFSRVFLGFASLFGVSKIKIRDEKKRFYSLSGTIVVANHPSLFDIVQLAALLPHMDFIIRGKMAHSVWASVLGQLYIVSRDGWTDLLAKASASLSLGNCIVIFPEGSRTPRHGTNRYKTTSARLALRTGVNVQPVYVGGSDKYGLGKHDPLWSYNKKEIYCYEIKLLPLIRTEEYTDLQKAETLMTKKMHDEIAAEAYLRDCRIV